MSGSRGRTLASGLALTATVLGLAAGAGATCPPFDVFRTHLGILGLHNRQYTDAEREAILKAGVIVGIWPPSGPAPLRVGVIWVVPPQDPQAIELDADGDGKPEVVDTAVENLGHEYAQPGRYAATVRVRSRDGKVATHKSPVTVLTPAAFEQELQARWATFREALERGQLDAALECVQYDRRREIERTLEDFLKTPVARTWPPIQFVKTEDVVDAVFRG